MNRAPSPRFHRDDAKHVELCKLRTRIAELEAEVARLKKANNDSLWCGQKDEKRIAELEAALGECIELADAGMFDSALDRIAQALRGEVGK